MGSQTDGKDQKKAEAPEVASGPTKDSSRESVVSEISATLFGISAPSVGGDNTVEEFIMKFKLDEVLKALISQKRISVRALAKRSRVPLSTLSGYLKGYLKPGRAQVDPSHLIALSQALGVSIDYLITGRELPERLKGLPTRQLFSGIVKLTIEDIQTGGRDDET